MKVRQISRQTWGLMTVAGVVIAMGVGLVFVGVMMQNGAKQDLSLIHI